MATRSEEARAIEQIRNSASKRVWVGVKPVTASLDQKRSVTASKKGRALHARTKSLADAKAGKPGDGKKVARWKSGPNGGEDVTTNGAGFQVRGADGPTGTTPSRKSTRGAWPAGEKLAAPLTSRVLRAVHTPASRAFRGK